MSARLLMVQGSSSSTGKSLLVTALCHIFTRRGLRVAPFKAQNMSNNAAVCPDGGEIGRAQALQAAAAGIAPQVIFNPVLVKPEADGRAQVVLLGRPWKTLAAGEFYRVMDELWAQVRSALDRLRAEYELVIMEGAGSPAELNLRKGDIVNMAVARYAQAPVLLVGDIDRGGIFAQLLGTLWLLPPEERLLVQGLVVNKFRGDASLFEEGIRILEERGGVPVLGMIPYLHDLRLPEEDAVALESLPVVASTSPREIDSHGDEFLIAIPRLPRIANFDDFDPLSREAGVRLRYVDTPADLGEPNALILPGTKSTIADLQWLRCQGLAEAIQAYAAQGGAVVGICGGYQMLGEWIYDPMRVESDAERLPGLELLPITTTFEGDKTTAQVRATILSAPGWLKALEGQRIMGYEIHMGQTSGNQPWLRLQRQSQPPGEFLDGASSLDGRIWGCYLHGLFDNAPLRLAWLQSLGWNPEPTSLAFHHDHLADALKRLADEVEGSLDMPRLEKIIWEE
jgi:adenosylcobyric acid synthase